MMMLKKYVNRLAKSEYFGNLSIQLIGTLIAQLIPIAISPLLSRLYKQDAFAILAIFMAVIGVLNVPNAGRYNIAIVKPCLLYTSPSPRDKRQSRMPSSA